MRRVLSAVEYEDLLRSCTEDEGRFMAAAVAGLFCPRGVRIRGAEAIGKSYPAFFEDLALIGGKTNAV